MVKRGELTVVVLGLVSRYATPSEPEWGQSQISRGEVPVPVGLILVGDNCDGGSTLLDNEADVGLNCLTWMTSIRTPDGKAFRAIPSTDSTRQPGTMQLERILPGTLAGNTE